jgi:acyl-coenzyme A thioesterase PaaI-like protein
VIEIEGTSTADDLKQELERELGIQVTVIEVGEGVFEVTVTDDTIATDLVNMINNVCRSH